MDSQKPTILVVDDCEVNREILLELFFQTSITF